MTNITTGAPKTGVIALSGMRPTDDGSALIRLQKCATTEPVSIVTGMRMPRWLVRIIMRDRGGTARPMKETGPQKEVTTAVRIPVMTRRQFLTT